MISLGFFLRRGSPWGSPRFFVSKGLSPLVGPSHGGLSLVSRGFCEVFSPPYVLSPVCVNPGVFPGVAPG